MSRDDLLLANYEVVKTATEQVAKYSPNCIIIVVTNPLDAMAQAAFMVSKFSKNRVIGMAGVLDSARFRTFIAQELNVSVENVTGVVMGGHGDTMVPLVRLSNVAGIPLTELMDQATIDRIVDRTAQRRRGDREVPEDGQRVLCAVGGGGGDGGVDSEGQEEGAALRRVSGRRVRHQRAVSSACPVKLGARGIEQIYEIKLTAEESAKLQKSAASVQELVNVLTSKK